MICNKNGMQGRYKKRLIAYKQLLKNSAEKGGLLFLSMLAAMVVCNIGYEKEYYNFFASYHSIDLFFQTVRFSKHHVINDFLMVFFFFSVGMEIKKELIIGHLATTKQRIMPMVAACCGVLVPVIIYLSFNYHSAIDTKGWAIPAATDIAFALGAISIFGNKIASPIKVFLTALAIIDDLIAILIITIFYTSNLNLVYLSFAFIIVLVLYKAHSVRFFSYSAFAILSFALWFCFVLSGVHATIAGVLAGLLVPIKSNLGEDIIEKFEKLLQPMIAYFIVPLFAFANSGLSLASLSWSVFNNSIVLGIIFGLFVGKQLGVFGAVYFMNKMNIIKIPANTTMTDFYGVAIICGIGFTMSLFVGVLAFGDSMHNVKIGVLAGSLLSFIVGSFVIMISQNMKKKYI